MENSVKINPRGFSKIYISFHAHDADDKYLIVIDPIWLHGNILLAVKYTKEYQYLSVKDEKMN